MVRGVISLLRTFAALAFLTALSGCGATIGDACTTARDCGGSVCLNRDFTPGGYCALPCTPGGTACPAGSVCVESAIGKDSPACMRSCRSSMDCRAGYVCKTEKNSETPICVGPEGI